MDTDTSEIDLIETAYHHLDRNRPVKAFFCLAAEAIRQLTRIADHLDAWSSEGGGRLEVNSFQHNED